MLLLIFFCKLSKLISIYFNILIQKIIKIITQINKNVFNKNKENLLKSLKNKKKLRGAGAVEKRGKNLKTNCKNFGQP